MGVQGERLVQVLQRERLLAKSGISQGDVAVGLNMGRILRQDLVEQISGCLVVPRLELFKGEIKQPLVCEVSIQRAKWGILQRNPFEGLESSAGVVPNVIIAGRILDRFAEGCDRFCHPNGLHITGAEIGVRLGHEREQADRLLEERDGAFGVLPNHRLIYPHGVICRVIIRVLAQQRFEAGFDIFQLPLLHPDQKPINGRVHLRQQFDREVVFTAGR